MADKEAGRGRVGDDYSRVLLERLIRSSKVSVAFLAIGFVGASVSRIPVTAKVISGIIDVGVIAFLIRYIMHCRKLLAVPSETGKLGES
jgi:hypothetical protein